jgi:hypothetical protein
MAAPRDQGADPGALSGGFAHRQTDHTKGDHAMDVAGLAERLHETAEHHDLYEKTHATHDWWDWYAAYMDARQHGQTPDAAADAAGLDMERVRGIAR